MATLSRPDRIELLAPAKTAAIGRDAVVHGADAVYIGGPAFGARHGASNTMAEIAGLVEFAHRFHVRVYVTINTILHDAELEAARQLAWQCHDAGVDALIVQDMGLLELDLPPIDLHASTQCDIRSPAKARFLADVGFSQLILARELDVAEIAAVRAALPPDAVIEYFIHGALCVAFSGLCFVSHAQTGRSANRGDCSQACRLPYTLKDKQGRVVAFEKHLLSLKDNNQSANLRALIDAGVRAFKIEGRYKEAPYVKNITAHYRRLLDEILTERPDLVPLSSGRTRLAFSPNPDKTFHRGATDYFARGRQTDIGAFDTPAFVGVHLGTISRIGTDWLELEANEALANGDGLTYLSKREVVGLQANRVERVQDSRWRVWPNGSIAEFPGLEVGLALSRNRDHAWDHALMHHSAERRIDIVAHFSDDDAGFRLTLTDADGIGATAQIPADKLPARDPGDAEAKLRKQLDRFGDSDFALRETTIALSQPWFVPPSLLNALRRNASESLLSARLAAHPRPRRSIPAEPPAIYPEESISYLANVYNAAARAFYSRHGVRLIEAAYEAHQQPGDVSLMVTKHCLRYSFSLCPKQAKGIAGVQGQVRAEAMTLINGNEQLTLQFDCRACEMHVIGRIKKHILDSPPPKSA